MTARFFVAEVNEVHDPAPVAAPDAPEAAAQPDAAAQVVPERRHVSPWKLIVAVPAIALLVVFGLMAFVAFLQPEGTLERPRALAEATLPDGSILSVERITWGKRHNHYVRMRRGGIEGVFDPTYGRSIPFATAEDRLVIWLSRHDAASGKPLGFEWWSHCTIVGDGGCETADDSPRLRYLGRRVSGGGGGSRPMKLPAAARRDDVQHVIAYSQFKPFRAAGRTFKLRFFNAKGKRVAEVTVPNPLFRRGFAKWTPEALPAVKEDGDLQVRLTRVWAEPAPQQNAKPGDREAIRVRIEHAATIDGKPTVDWTLRSTRVIDALGNEDADYRCRLCPQESAWKLRMRFQRNSDAEFPPDEVWTVGRIELPAASTTVSLDGHNTVGGVGVTLSSAAGGGTVQYRRTQADRRSTGSSSRSGSAFGKSYRVQRNTRNGVETTTVTSQFPHVRFRFDGVGANASLKLLATAANGSEVRTHSVPMQLEERLWLLDLPADAKAVTLKLIVQQPRTFEFFIQPPRVGQDGKNPPPRDPGAAGKNPPPRRK